MMALLPFVLLLGVLALLPLVAGGELHAQERSLTGEWEFTVESPNGTGTRQVNLIQKGDSLSGTIASSRASGPISGWIKADTVTILAVLAMESGPFTVVYEGTVQGDTMAGIVGFGDYGAGTFTGRRVEGRPWKAPLHPRSAQNSSSSFLAFLGLSQTMAISMRSAVIPVT